MKMMNIPYNNHKTQRCKYFDDTGNCKFGKNCSYAHGEAELRNPYDALPVPPLFPMEGQAGGDMYDEQRAGGEAKPQDQQPDVKLLVTSANESEVH